MAKDIEIEISKLRLDPENPRIAGEEGQLNIRQALLDDQGTKIAELAEDIAEFGMNPMDRMMVLQPDPNKQEFISLEGNRRTAALQILENPDLLHDLSLPDALRDRLITLAEGFDTAEVEPLPAVLMPTRESAKRWIELRHTGQNGGRGIVDWNGVQTARFRGDKMLRLLEFVKSKGELTGVEIGAISNNFPITTLDRLISNPVVRQKIGIQIVDGEFYFSFPWKEELKSLKRIVVDLATKKINVSSVKSKEQQIAYVDSLPKDALPSGKKLSSPISLTNVLNEAPPPTPPTPSPPPSPLARKTLVPKGFVLTIANQKISQIFYELRGLNIEKYPVAGAVLLRCFVEALIDAYCSSHAINLKHLSGKNAGKPLSLSEKVEVVLQSASNLTSQQATAARIALTGKDSVISIQRLHEYVHNPAVFPSKADLIGGWSSVEAFFRAVAK
jgi:hypothetical protein